ncbi:RbsD/FucU family protein [Diaminobutyricibacter sp. McL0618]|uniref:RbsD/FucU family protein n=1 Tax=Leifsonia sp. McL0618 TaxID=3415677 RepID=UPI003CF8F4E0
MGHGDRIAVVDRNYPAYAAGVPVIRLDGVGVVDALGAILTLLPVDDFDPTPVARMAVVGAEKTIPAVADEAITSIQSVENRAVGVEVLERESFYARAKSAVAVVATGEARAYGCFILTKGVL